MNDMIEAPFGGALTQPGVVDANALLVSAAATVGSNSDKPLLTFKNGEYGIGQDHEEPDPEGLWAINAHSFMFGWQEWLDGEPGGEFMAPAGTPAPTDSVPMKWPEKGELAAQGSFEAYCVSGDDVGIEVLFKSSTKGGSKAVNTMAHAIAKQAQSGSTAVFPLVKLGSTSYDHKKFKRTIYTPVLEVIEWVDSETLMEMVATAEPPEIETEAPEEAEKPAAKSRPARRNDGPKTRGRRRRRAG